MRTAQLDGLRKSAPGPGHHLRRNPDAAARLPLDFCMHPSITHALVHVRDSVKKNRGFHRGRKRLWKCRFCRRLLLRHNALQKRAAARKCRRKLFFRNSSKKHSRRRTSLAAYVHTAVDALNSDGSLPCPLLAKAGIRDRKFRKKSFLLAAFHLHLQHFHSLLRRSRFIPDNLAPKVL